ncbi:MAG: hypothetical protein ABGZ53_07215, partial [Fuerstiella sp.]
AVGGTAGVGVNFLEETFSTLHANPDHRLHQQAAREVLKALLPEVGSDIKGHMKSHAELLEVSGYGNRPNDFNALLRILDGELRLITPTDPEGVQTESGSDPGSKFYQLTHDYLVPSLQTWLTRKQQETRKGRAELKLAERTALWNAKPENRHLPSLMEWGSIRTLTEKKQWTEPQQKLMKRAAGVHGLRSVIAIAVACVMTAAGVGFTRQADERRNQAESERLVDGLLTADTAVVRGTIEKLKGFRAWADPLLQGAFADSPEDSNARLHAGLALVAPGQTVDQNVLDVLRERLLTVAPIQFGPVSRLLEPHKQTLVPFYWERALDDQQSDGQRFHAACALAMFDPESESAANGDAADAVGWRNPAFARFIGEQLVAVSPEYIGEYKEQLRPVAASLVAPLADIFQDPDRGELALTLATSLLADYTQDDPERLTELVLVADSVSDRKLFPVLQQHRTAAVEHLETVLDQQLEPDWHDGPLDAAWVDVQPADRARVEAAQGLITERFAFCQDMPWVQFLEVVETLRASGYRPTRIRPHALVHPPAGGEGGRRPDEEVAVNVAAIWTRDGKRWELQSPLTKSDLPAADAPATKDGLFLSDI